MKIIYHRPDCDEECRFVTMLSKKKFDTDLLMFKCLQGTIVENSGSYCKRVSHNDGTRGNKTTLRIPRVRTKAARKSCWFQSPSCFNETPVDIRLCGLCIFISISNKTFAILLPNFSNFSETNTANEFFLWLSQYINPPCE